ncbi:MAG: DNA mismatch repair protein MutS, partial [Myxococcota bacterium]
PLMRQYAGIKAQHPDALVFFRMGDFYELFGADAECAAPLLDITLTSRDKGKPDAVPMCGVPVHSAEGYVRKLAALGHKVAICEQVEDARRVTGKRLVRRAVVEVVTPGLQIPEAEAREVAVLALAVAAGEAGVAALDASTGSFRATRDALDGERLSRRLLDELDRIAPREVLLAHDAPEALGSTVSARLPGVPIARVAAESFETGAAPVAPHGFQAGSARADQRAAAAVLAYLAANQPAAVEQAPRLRGYALGDTMIVDAATRRHLELFESSEDRSRRGTLIERIDETVTPLGARRLVRWLGYPLCDVAAIGARQARVAVLAESDRARGRLREALGGVRDLERRFARCERPGAEPRDLAALRSSLGALPAVAEASTVRDEMLTDAAVALPRPEALEALTQLLQDALVDDPRPLPRGSRGANETGYVRPGFRPELDALRDSARKGREWVAGLEQRERERTGITSLKVRFHPVLGYGLEVTKANLDRVPADYERRQTLANAERFTTPELREREATILSASERAAALERETLDGLRQEVLAHAEPVRAAAGAVAELDALQSLAEVARRDGWVRPHLDDSETLSIRAGRHPVVEQMLAERSTPFVPNDAALAQDATRILLLTGPNMSGKSTYLRQVALLVLLAQMGSFVPAESAEIGVVDRIFTRVGASDRLAQGESTFLVEMRETAEILAQASHKSLVILDEIGRGTSTFDGLSIAWAVAEYLHDTKGLRPRTLFATHYHELADLARSRDGIANGHFEVREWQGEVVFLRRLLPGEVNRSYGIEVAELAGLPASVITRARAVLTELEAERHAHTSAEPVAGAGAARSQLDLFTERRAPAEDEALAALREIDPLRTTPLDALALLTRLRERLDPPDGAER